MKKYFFAFSVILILANMAFAGSLKIDRAWVDGRYGYALVTYTNNSTKTFGAVTIQCTALDSKNNKININTRSFFDHVYGPIIPGFEGTLKVPVDLHGITMDGMSCKAIEKK